MLRTLLMVTDDSGRERKRACRAADFYYVRKLYSGYDPYALHRLPWRSLCEAIFPVFGLFVRNVFPHFDGDG